MLEDLYEKGRRFLRTRAAAYQRIFLGHGVDTDVVLADLATFCRADQSTFHADHSISDRLDGRREVWLRIAQHLHLTESELWALYGNKHLPTKE